MIAVGFFHQISITGDMRLCTIISVQTTRVLVSATAVRKLFLRLKM